MFQNMLMTTLTSLRDTNEITCWDNRPFITKWPEVYETKPKIKAEITKTIKKKPKRIRTSFTTDQINHLESEFLKHPYIDVKKRSELARITKIAERKIQIWFQNRRMKKKRLSSESYSDNESTRTSDSPPVPSISQYYSDEPASTYQPNSPGVVYGIKPQLSENNTGYEYQYVPQVASPFYFESNPYPNEYLPYQPTYNHENHDCGGLRNIQQTDQNQDNFNWYNIVMSHS